MNEYAYVNQNGLIKRISDINLAFKGTWSSAGTYSPPIEAADYGSSRFIVLAENTNTPPPGSPAWAELVITRVVNPTDPFEIVQTALDAASAATNDALTASSLANEAILIAQSGTNLAAAANALATSALQTGSEALVIAQAGTNLAQQALSSILVTAVQSPLTVSSGTLALGPVTPGSVTGTQIDVITATGTTLWTVPAGAKSVDVLLIGGGGGGGYGGFSSSTALAGGAGGGGGGYTRGIFSASDLGDSVVVIVGTQGGGGRCTGPIPSTAGGFTSFGTLLFAGGGNPGDSGVSASLTNGGTGGTGLYTGGTGGNGGIVSSVGGKLGSQSTGLGGGGGGGGATLTLKGATGPGADGGASPVAFNSRPGGVGGVNTGNDGTHGNPDPNFGNLVIKTQTGSGGGGGISSPSPAFAAAGSGGEGGFYGGGGGGGGADFSGSGTTNSSGPGGKGGPGIAVIVTYF